MSQAAPTLNQIRAKVTAIRQKRAHARIIGINSPARWNPEPSSSSAVSDLWIRQCDSPLAMRLALREPVAEGVTKVLLTPLDEKTLSDDILVRLERRRLFHLDVWETVRMLFQAHQVDPRLASRRWIGEALLESMPPEGYPAVRGGFLDAETAWSWLLRRQVGLESDRPDLMAILRWSGERTNIQRFLAQPDEFRSGMTEWLSEQAGAVARLILSSLVNWQDRNALTVGLAAAVLSHPDAARQLERSLGKFEERFLSGQVPNGDELPRWSAASTEAVRALRHSSEKLHHFTVQQADQILRELGAEDWAYLSDTSLAGFDQRLRRFGQCLAEICQDGAWDRATELEVLRKSLREHDEFARETRRLTRVDMATRLVHWMASQRANRPEMPRSLAEAAASYLQTGGYIDWARWNLRAGDPVRELSAAYQRLIDAVTGVREDFNSHFSQLLVDWTAAGSSGSDVIPVERVLDEVVAPLAKERAVLLIVIDGMSVAVSRELTSDLLRQEWVALSEPGRTRLRPGLAAIPSVTEFSRTSLLTGKLQAGDSTTELAGFSGHPALVAVSRASHPPILFHKGNLQEPRDAVLSPDIRDAIQSSHRRVVGVVINAVDDHLTNGDQLDLRWSREEIRLLPSLLYEARQAGRLVVLVSDHGHALDWQTVAGTKDESLGGERWQPANRPPQPGEVLIRGPRVLADPHQLLAAGNEKLRYTRAKRNGYHGGVTPQEMVIPITILAGSHAIPKGWNEHPVEIPDWWDGPVLSSPEVELPRSEPESPRVDAPGRLFHPVTLEPTSDSNLPHDSTTTWIAELLASPVYSQQVRLAGRGVPDHETLTRLLTALDRRGGKLTTVALARALDLPEMRLPGLLAKVQRLLNVDGYPVFQRDEPSQTVELNRRLLATQFGLEQA